MPLHLQTQSDSRQLATTFRLSHIEDQTTVLCLVSKAKAAYQEQPHFLLSSLESYTVVPGLESGSALNQDGHLGHYRPLAKAPGAIAAGSHGF